jgi:hypothetical protein
MVWAFRQSCSSIGPRKLIALYIQEIGVRTLVIPFINFKSGVSSH